MCNRFLLTTFTQICVTVANLIAVCIQIASAYPEPAKQTLYIFISIFITAIFGWLYLYLHVFFKLIVVLIITNLLLKIIPCSCKVWKEGIEIFFIRPFEIFILII